VLLHVAPQQSAVGCNVQQFPQNRWYDSTPTTSKKQIHAINECLFYTVVFNQKRKRNTGHILAGPGLKYQFWHYTALILKDFWIHIRVGKVFSCQRKYNVNLKMDLKREKTERTDHSVITDNNDEFKTKNPYFISVCLKLKSS